MSMSYGIEYNILIKGKKDELKKLKEIASEMTSSLIKMNEESYSSYPKEMSDNFIKRYRRNCQDIEDKINNGIKEWKEIGNDEAVISISYAADDCSHCIIGNYLNAAEEKLGGISIAARIDIYAEEYKVSGCVYTVEGESLDFGTYDEKGSDLNIQDALDSGEIFPKEADWIPQWMRRVEYKENYGDEDFDDFEE